MDLEEFNRRYKRVCRTARVIRARNVDLDDLDIWMGWDEEAKKELGENIKGLIFAAPNLTIDDYVDIIENKESEICPDCKGKGKRMLKHYCDNPWCDGHDLYEETCHTCEGTGRITEEMKKTHAMSAREARDRMLW